MSTKRAKTSRGSSSRYPLRLTLDEHLQRYDTVKDKEVRHTRFTCEETLRDMRIADDVDWLFSKLDMREFIRLKHPSYSDLTKEFFSTVTLNSSPSLSGSSILEFRLGGINHRLTLNQFNGLFGFSGEGITHYNENNCSERLDFWEEISGIRRFNPSSSNAKYISNPIIKIAHKILACTIFGRLDLNTIRVVKLLFLEYMLNDRSINVGAFLVQHLVHVAKGNRAIVISDIITHITIQLGVSLNERIADVGFEKINMKSLRSMKLVKRLGNIVLWVHPNRQSLEITSTDFVTIRNRANLSFDQWHGQAFPLVAQPQEEETEAAEDNPSSIPQDQEGTTHGGGSCFEEHQGPSTSHFTPHGSDFSSMLGTLDLIMQNQNSFQEQLSQFGQNQTTFQDQVYQRIATLESKVDQQRDMWEAWRQWQSSDYPPPPP